ncbi:FtsK/SpoIIIE domain-containing protein [Leifsonia sp. NPDC080035]|uniref:FtsK/SpoIIIE domain-containing protein n=1 Tax=Leifsonia sp. NPDC080035 TaxID=3143936 RepID=A0AAU7GCY3_9MICO
MATYDIERLPIGTKPDGSTATISLKVHSLIAGTSGFGKSILQQNVRIGAAHIENLAMIGIDPNLSELALWKDRYSFITKGVCCVEPLLDALMTQMQLRMQLLAMTGRKKVEPHEWGMLPLPNGALFPYPGILVETDELAAVLSANDGKGDDVPRRNNYRRLAAEARKTSIMLISATQRLSADLTPRSFTGNHANRLSVRTANQAETVMVFDQKEEFLPAHELPLDVKGLAYMTTEGDPKGTKFRSAFVPTRIEQENIRNGNDEAMKRAFGDVKTVEDFVEETAHLRVPLPWLDEAMADHMAFHAGQEKAMQTMLNSMGVADTSSGFSLRK